MNPSTKLTEAETMVVAIIEPMATVQAKSKLDILEKLRLPNSLVNIIVDATIKNVVIVIKKTVLKELVIHFSMILGCLGWLNML